MVSTTRTAQIENAKKPHGILKPRVVVRLRQGVRSNAHLASHQAYLVLRAYSSSLLDRRTILGRLIAERERAYAHHHGYDRLEDCPATLRSDIHLCLRAELFLMIFTPDPDSRTGGQLIRSAENALHRIYTDWGFKPVEKPVPDLERYLAGLETEGQGDA